MANKQVSNTAKQLAGDFGTLRDTFFEMGENRISNQQEQLDIGDESRRAIRAIDTKIQHDQMVHTYKMTDMRFKDLQRRHQDALTAKAIGTGFNLMDLGLTRSRNERQYAEMRRKMGLDDFNRDVIYDAVDTIPGGSPIMNDYIGNIEGVWS